jgi:hypothetical protein
MHVPVSADSCFTTSSGRCPEALGICYGPLRQSRLAIQAVVLQVRLHLATRDFSGIGWDRNRLFFNVLERLECTKCTAVSTFFLFRSCAWHLFSPPTWPQVTGRCRLIAPSDWRGPRHLVQMLGGNQADSEISAKPTRSAAYIFECLSLRASNCQKCITERGVAWWLIFWPPLC